MSRHGRADDAGGVWILTGVVLGLLVYALMVLMAIAGFSAVVPLVVIPPVVLALIGANNLLGGGRGYGRSSGSAEGRDPVPLSSLGSQGTVGPTGSQGTVGPTAGPTADGSGPGDGPAGEPSTPA